jgi:hypothetical protein
MKYELNEDDITFICNIEVTAKEIMERYGCGRATVCRWRKKYGWKGRKGCKKGKLKPWQKTGRIVNCKVCDTEIYEIPSEPRTYCSRECQYSDDDYIQKLREIDRSYMQTEEYSKIMSNESTPAYKKYRNRVQTLTERVYKKHIDIINPDNHPRTLAGVEGGWQLDHIIEVRFGFDNDIPPEAISELENLRMLPWKENLERNKTS